MLKVLLVYDDYTELTAIEGMLKKVGFDTIGITSEFSTSEKVLSFNPEIVISYGRGPKMTTLGVGKRLKDMSRWTGKSILIFPPGFKPNPQDLIKTRMDMILEAPVPTAKLLQIIAKLTNQDEKVWLEKLAKTAAADEAIKISGGSDAQAKKGKQDSVFVGSGNKTAEEKNYIGGSRSSADENNFVGGSGKNEDEAQNLKGGAAAPDAIQKKLKNQFPLREREQEIKGGSREDEESRNLKGRSSTSSEDQSVSGGNLTREESQEIQGQNRTDEEKTNLTGTVDSEGPTSIIKAGSQAENAVHPLTPPNLNQPHFQNELEEARKKLGEKIQNYKTMTKDIVVPKESTLTRAKVRKEQNKLRKEWSQEKLEDQDKLRREFTNALFKKTN